MNRSKPNSRSRRSTVSSRPCLALRQVHHRFLNHRVRSVQLASRAAESTVGPVHHASVGRIFIQTLDQPIQLRMITALDVFDHHGDGMRRSVFPGSPVATAVRDIEITPCSGRAAKKRNPCTKNSERRRTTPQLSSPPRETAEAGADSSPCLTNCQPATKLIVFSEKIQSPSPLPGERGRG
jgi:hypothetical protein